MMGSLAHVCHLLVHDSVHDVVFEPCQVMGSLTHVCHLIERDSVHDADSSHAGCTRRSHLPMYVTSFCGKVCMTLFSSHNPSNPTAMSSLQEDRGVTVEFNGVDEYIITLQAEQETVVAISLVRWKFVAVF